MMISAICNTMPVLAHPGHGTIPADNAAHYLIEPVHSFWIVLTLILACTATLIYCALKRKRATTLHQDGKQSQADLH